MLSDISIIRLCENNGMIKPYARESLSLRGDGMAITSHGVSSFGYDLSLGPTIRRMRSLVDLAAMGYSFHGAHRKLLVMDPSNFNPIFYGDVELIPDEGLILMPGEFILSVSNEHVNMPPNISAICMQKSTCARTQLRVEVTPLEAGWSGYVTYEICNPTPHPILLHKGQGITQALFFEGDQPCETTYLDRGGKYQNQPQEPVIPRSKHKPTTGYPYLTSVNGQIKLAHFPLPEEVSKVPESTNSSMWEEANKILADADMTPDTKTFTLNHLNVLDAVWRDCSGVATTRKSLVKHAGVSILHHMKTLKAAPLVELLKTFVGQTHKDANVALILCGGILNAIANSMDVTVELFDEAITTAKTFYNPKEFYANERQEFESSISLLRQKIYNRIYGFNGTSASDFQQAKEDAVKDPEAAMAASVHVHAKQLLSNLGDDVPESIKQAVSEVAFEASIEEETATTKAWYDSAPVGISVADAIKVIAKEVHTDQGYAWSWICNLAMMAKDAGASNVAGNKGASNLMYNLFKYRAWAVNDTFKSHIEDAERDTRLSKDDTELVFSPASVDPTFTNEGFRQEIDVDAMKELITHTRATGFTTGAKPGSAAARLGILPVNDRSTLAEKMEEEGSKDSSASIYITAENMEEQLPKICRLIESIRDDKLVSLVIRKQPE